MDGTDVAPKCSPDHDHQSGPYCPQCDSAAYNAYAACVEIQDVLLSGKTCMPALTEVARIIGALKLEFTKGE